MGGFGPPGIRESPCLHLFGRKASGHKKFVGRCSPSGGWLENLRSAAMAAKREAKGLFNTVQTGANPLTRHTKSGFGPAYREKSSSEAQEPFNGHYTSTVKATLGWPVETTRITTAGGVIPLPWESPTGPVPTLGSPALCGVGKRIDRQATPAGHNISRSVYGSAQRSGGGISV
jgi:hypothetical protein